ncbi:Protein of unknown function [Pyronema omphalodes CBS 100304]|uniref:Uncharacterized protein n=1 Tax=Pyronema omphalodes (strain CBS 100304) TaxID=1076935 RepID=U4LUH9_PYROM|nr:Protein of unknown function [Pyronema omphalodes CBS 100304]
MLLSMTRRMRIRRWRKVMRLPSTATTWGVTRSKR